MKTILSAAICMATITINAQINTPQPSPAAKITQAVGMNNLEVEYSRPHRRDRVIFGDLVPFNELWRTGANKNTIITTNDIMIFGSDTLKPGSYAIFTKPMDAKSWDVYFYTDTENWGTPETWMKEKIALRVSANVTKAAAMTESFTISFDNVTIDGAELSFAWETTKAVVSFSVPTDERVRASIAAVMAGPSAGDYYKAADYYLAQKTQLDLALEYIDKAITMKDPAPFWYTRKKALIQAELRQFKAAIKTAEISKAAALEAGNTDYVKMNEDSIAEWSKKIK